MPVVVPENIVVDPAMLMEEQIPLRTKHLFVLERSGDTLVLHVALAERHQDIVMARRIDPASIVGGGLLCVLHHVAVLWLGGKSGDYGAIPPQAQATFASLLAHALRDRGIAIVEARGDTDAMAVNAYWRALG